MTTEWRRRFMQGSGLAKYRWRFNESSGPFSDSGNSGSPAPMSAVGNAAGGATALFGHSTCLSLTANGTGTDGARASGIALNLTQPFSVAWACNLAALSGSISVPVWELSDHTGNNLVQFFWNWSQGTCYIVTITGSTTVVTAQPGYPVIGSSITAAVSFTPAGSGNYTTTWWTNGINRISATTALGTILASATAFSVVAGYYSGGGFTSRSGDRFSEFRLYNFALNDTQAAAINAESIVS